MTQCHVLCFTLGSKGILTLYSSIIHVYSSVVVDSSMQSQVTLPSVTSHSVEVSLICILINLVVF